jgi:hypothetical protein
MNSLFAPFDKMSMAALDGREGAGREIKSSTIHMRGYGDRMTPDADAFYRSLAQYTL